MLISCCMGTGLRPIGLGGHDLVTRSISRVRARRRACLPVATGSLWQVTIQRFPLLHGSSKNYRAMRAVRFSSMLRKTITDKNSLPLRESRSPGFLATLARGTRCSTRYEA